MQCPNCGSKKTIPVSLHMMGTGKIVQPRRCKRCKHEWKPNDNKS